MTRLKKEKNIKNNDVSKDEKQKFDEFFYKKDRLNQLRGFCKTVQCKCNSSEAARQLGLEVATIGKQIRGLERNLNITLFDRTIPTKLVLSEDGKNFYDKAVVALQHVDGLFQNFRTDLEDERKNNLRIASIDAILDKIFPYIIKFKEKYPKLNISLLNISKYDALERLKNGKIDLALFPNDISEKCPVELKKEQISKYTEYWIMYKGHPLENKDEKEITKEDIANYPFGILSESVYLKSLEHFFKEYNPESPIILEKGTIDILKTMIRNKTCLAIINEVYLNEKEKSEFILKNTIGSMPQVYYYNFSIKNNDKTEKTKEFLDIIKKNHNKIFH